MGRDTAEDWKLGIESVCNFTETAEENGVTLVIEPLIGTRVASLTPPRTRCAL